MTESLPVSPAKTSRYGRLETLGRLLAGALPHPGAGVRHHIAARAPAILTLLQASLEGHAELLLEPGPTLGGLFLGRLEDDFAPLQARLDLHGVARLAFLRGITAADLQALIEGLVQEPEALEGLGGLRGHLDRCFAQAIQLRAPEPVPDFIPEHLLEEVRGTLAEAIAPPDAFTGNTAGWLHLVATLDGFGRTGHRLGLGRGEPEDRQLEVLRRALADLSPEQVLSLARGLGSLPTRPEGLPAAFRMVLPGFLGPALARLAGRGIPWLVLQDPLLEVLDAFPAPLAALLPALGEGLAGLRGEPLVDAFLAEAAWRSVPLQEQLDQARRPGRLLDLPEASRVHLLERALRARRMEDLVGLLGILDEALLREPDPGRRSAALRSLRDFLPRTAASHVPDYLVDALESLLLGALKTSQGPDQVLRESLGALLEARLGRRQPAQALRVLQAAEALAAGAGGAVHAETVAWLRRALEQDAALDAVLGCLHGGDRAESLAGLQPLLVWLGEPFLHHAAWTLGLEPERGRRDRLIRALRAAGPEVEPVVLRMLRPAMPWYHARNLLGVLAGTGGEAAVPKVLPFLNHDDPRVRVAALRALRHCAQRKAIPHLIACLSDDDPALQQEAIHLLGQQKSFEGVRPLTQLLLDREAPRHSRRKAAESLVLIGSHDALDPLAELAGRRGGLLRSPEPEDLRRAAAQALASLGGRGLGLLERLAAAEGRGALAEHFRSLAQQRRG